MVSHGCTTPVEYSHRLAASGGSAAAGGLPDGLVEEVTSHTRITGPSRWAILKDLNKQRRIKRMKRVVRAAADASRDRHGFRTDCLMLTLTYAEADAWRPRHLSAFLNTAKEWLSRRRIPRRYQWVLELTKAGRVHYHVLFWVPHGVKLPKPDDAGWWRHGMTRIEKARRGPAYITKYASKGCGDDEAIPKGARLFGVGLSGSTEADRAERVGNHRAGLPRWLRESTAGRCSRVRGGWLERDSGQLHASPFTVLTQRDALGIWTVEIIRTGLPVPVG